MNVFKRRNKLYLYSRRFSLFKKYYLDIHKRYFTTNENAIEKKDTNDIENIRNIGILAHIDAGKTTITERMLYYSGQIKRMGEVHDGNTAMDFMKQERERGITINSAVTTFFWKKDENNNKIRINLIDTPGHVDFTIEVERSLRVLDGAVLVLDGMKGVEPQTETVWQQANKYKVSRLAFINKMDRDGACYYRTMKTMKDKLNIDPIPIQYPVIDYNGSNNSYNISGIVDLITMEYIQWTDKDGSVMRKLPLININSVKESLMNDLFHKAMEKRIEMIEKIADYDETIADYYLNENIQEITKEKLYRSIRNININKNNKCIFVLCGSALKNMGIQLLLDAINLYLPSPLDNKTFEIFVNNNKKSNNTKDIVQREVGYLEKDDLILFAFKVKNDQHCGPIVYFRVYSGVLHNKSQLINTTQSVENMEKNKSNAIVRERVNRLLEVYADQTEDVQMMTTGNLGALIGLKSTATGDTLISNDGNTKKMAMLKRIDVPVPVFTCSIAMKNPLDIKKNNQTDDSSNSENKELEKFLKDMEKEDPSFIVTKDEETNQTLISGMGELHLEIIKDRILNEFTKNDGLVPVLGPMRVAYRESLTCNDMISNSNDYFIHKYEVITGSNRQYAKIAFNITPFTHDEIITHNTLNANELNKIIWHNHTLNDDHEKDVISEEESGNHDMNPLLIDMTLRKRLPDRLKEAINDGFMKVLMDGILTNHRIGYLNIKINGKKCDYHITDSNYKSFYHCAMHGMKKFIINANNNNILESIVMEPIMKVIITTPEIYMGDILSDLSGHKRARIININSNNNNNNNIIESHVPLADMIGYSTNLRSKSKGEATFSMNFLNYDKMDTNSLKKYIEMDKIKINKQMIENPLISLRDEGNLL